MGSRETAARPLSFSDGRNKGEAMNKIKFMAYLIIIIILGGFSIANSGLQQKNGFSILFPDGWVEVPRDIIDAYQKEMAKLAPNVHAQYYDYAFQLAASQRWFEHPYIVVQIKNLGHIPESELEKIIEYSVQASVNEYKDNLNSIATDIQFGKMVYDKQTKIIWMPIKSNVVNVGPVSGLSGMIPTEKGFIQIVGYSLRNDYSTYGPIFRSIVLSVTPEPSLVYKPKWSDSLPPAVSGIDWGKVLAKAIGGAIAAALIASIVGLFKKRKG